MITALTLFKCMADDTRLKLLLLLSEHQQLCVCHLQSALQLSQPKISRHLALLREKELVLDDRRGKWVHYRLNPSLPQWMITLIKNTATNNQDYLHNCQLHLSASCSPEN